MMLVRATGARMAVECKWTEAEFGSCSRTRLAPGEPAHCDGNYLRQQRGIAQCTLTKQDKARHRFAALRVANGRSPSPWRGKAE